MALISTVLAGRLTQVLGQPSDNAALKAQGWASAYHTYALPVMAGVLFPTFIGLEQSAFAAKLLTAFSNPQNTPAQFAQVIADAVEIFWLLPPVVFSLGAVAGAVTSFPGKGALVAGLTSVFGGTYPRHEGVAQNIATVMDIATRTVVVTFAPPPGSTTVLV